jgi:hypothetical protein
MEFLNLRQGCVRIGVVGQVALFDRELDLNGGGELTVEQPR